MATSTATIRVPRETRDLLAHQAHEQGMSLASLLAQIAKERELEERYAAERQARREEEGDPVAEEERLLWETTNEDGIDFDDGLTVYE